jgi:hypothetical protein
MSMTKPGTQELSGMETEKRMDCLEDQSININIDIIQSTPNKYSSKQQSCTPNYQEINRDSTRLFDLPVQERNGSEESGRAGAAQGMKFRSKDEQIHFEKLVMSAWGRNKRLSYREYAIKRPVRLQRIAI